MAHLAEIAKWDAGAAVDLPLSISEGRAFVADAAPRLTMLDAQALEPLAQVPLDEPASRAPWALGR